MRMLEAKYSGDRIQPETLTASVKYPGLRQQPDDGQSRGPLFRTISRLLRSQFGRPTGLWGNLAGKIMACSASNHDRSRWTISLLDIQPSDRLLEIGFGPGIAIELASRKAPEGFVAGIDHSEVMLRQAEKRNASAIRDGKVSLSLGSISQLPSFDQPFDKIFTINSIHFWTDATASLKQLRTLLRSGGMIAVAVQPRSRNATEATAKLIGEELVESLRRAGFSHCRLEMRQTRSAPVACAVGIK